MTPHQNQMLRKARILDCYSNADQLVKKSEERLELEKADDTILGKEEETRATNNTTEE